MVATSRASELVEVALTGLASMRYGGGPSVPFTLRGAAGGSGPEVHPEGSSLRYAAIVALGLGKLDHATQRLVLGGHLAADLARACWLAAADDPDPGAAALARWALAEVTGEPAPGSAAALLVALSAPRVDTVAVAWALTAALAAGDEELAERARLLLDLHRSPAGTYPHRFPAGRGIRSHVGSFADQIYPLQAMARLAAATDDEAARRAATATAEVLVAHQGLAGQWWWHYDARVGELVESYPVYSVHQHGMAPMALADLAAAGGPDYTEPVQRGLSWIDTHPEVMEPLVAPQLGVVWRKVGRREPRKAARKIQAAASRVWAGVRAPGMDTVFPPVNVDYECRPYELGWLVYAQAARA
ncbi:MAG: hypothetical protein ACK5KO_09805 [Arachnia sp.]